MSRPANQPSWDCSSPPLHPGLRPHPVRSLQIRDNCELKSQPASCGAVGGAQWEAGVGGSSPIHLVAGREGLAEVSSPRDPQQTQITLEVGGSLKTLVGMLWKWAGPCRPWWGPEADLHGTGLGDPDHVSKVTGGRQTRGSISSSLLWSVSGASMHTHACLCFCLCLSVSHFILVEKSYLQLLSI